VDISELPGPLFPLQDTGVNQNDIANFVQKNRDWGPKRMESLIKLFEEDLDTHSLMILKVNPVTEGAAIGLRASPYLLITADSVLRNPDLDYPGTE
jgi:hypothetical protein